MPHLYLLLLCAFLFAAGLLLGFFSARAIYKRKQLNFYHALAADKKYNRSIA